MEDAGMDHSNHSHSTNGKPSDVENKNAKREEDILSTEQIFECTKAPGWREQLTFRAFVVSFMLGIMFSIIVMKFNLTTGIVPSLNVSAGLLGFFFVKIWTKLLEKSHLLKQPFTRQENTVIQTCVVASSGIAFSGGFGSYLLGMSDTIAKQSTEQNGRENIKNPALGWMIGFLFVVSFLGLFSVVPLRKVVRENFPSELQQHVWIDGIHNKMMYLDQGTNTRFWSENQVGLKPVQIIWT